MIRYLLISISFHTTLFTILISVVLWQPKNNTTDTPIINIYTLTNNHSQPISRLSNKLASQKNRSSKTTNISQQQKSVDQIKMIIHDLIQINLKYPHNIRIPIKPKMLIASLVIFPDGRIENLKIIKSSGLSIFDREVIETINSLPPIKKAAQYVKKPPPHEIPVEFMKSSKVW